MNWTLILNFLAAMLAIVNPIGLIPIWKEMTADAIPAVRKRIALMVTGSALLILLIFLNLGEFILSFFGIEISVFKIAGGILLLLTGISMVNGTATKLEDKNEKGDTPLILAKKRFRKVLVPLTMPMLAGPGSLTTVILFSSKADGLMNYISLSVILIAVYISLVLVFAYSYKIEHQVDDLFFVGFTRIFGVIVAAIAVQFIVEGAGSIFPVLQNGSSKLESP
ncbi:MAG: MarC family protein [Bacteroidota bacterium]|nr:MarC family protein [Bacteroidota bacterium]